MSISFLLNNNILSIVLDGDVQQVSVDDPIFPSIKNAISNNDLKSLRSLLSHKTNSTKEAEKRVKEAEKIGCKVVGETLYYNGEVVHNAISSKIKEYIKIGLPYEPLVLFMQNLMLNPSRNSVQQLFSFLENKNLPITDDGCFLAYKAVRNDLKDIHSGTILNDIGSVISIPRNKVDDNPSNHCSYGLHCGALEYVRNFGRGDSKYLVVKVNPKDVVSVPSDHNCQKIRVCEYKVVEFFTKPLSSLYSGDSSDTFVYHAEFDPDEDSEYDDVDDYDDFDDFDPDDEDDYDDLVKSADFIYVNGSKYVREGSVEQTDAPVAQTMKRDKMGRFCKS